MAKASRSLGVLAGACLALTLWSSVARAEPSPDEQPAAPEPPETPGDDGETARKLFKEARWLAGEGRHIQACPKFEESLKLSAGIGTQFNLADCWEHVGRTASAHALFLNVADEALKVGQKERSDVARSRAAALEPKLSRLTVEVEPQEGPLEVRRGSILLDKSQWGTALPVDPGSYELTASAPGMKPWSSRVKVPAAPIVVSVSVPKLEAEAAGPTTASAKPVAKPRLKRAPAPAEKRPAPQDEPPAVRDGGRRLQAGTLLLAGVGVAGAVAGVTFALQFQTSNNDAAAVCRSSVNCSKEELALYDELTKDARKARTLSYVSFGVSGLALGGAAIFYLVSGEEPEDQKGSALRAAPLVAADGSLGASLTGSF